MPTFHARSQSTLAASSLGATRWYDQAVQARPAITSANTPTQPPSTSGATSSLNSTANIAAAST